KISGRRPARPRRDAGAVRCRAICRPGRVPAIHARRRQDHPRQGAYREGGTRSTQGSEGLHQGDRCSRVQEGRYRHRPHAAEGRRARQRRSQGDVRRLRELREMRIVCGPSEFAFESFHGDLEVVLFGHDPSKKRGSAGAAIGDVLRRRELVPDPRALDFLSVALAVMAADLAGHRDASPDGWTREFDLVIAVTDAPFWSTQAPVLQQLLQFLTTDRWRIAFAPGAKYPKQPKKQIHPEHDSIVLFSGGLDSFTGALDLVEQGYCPFAVSQSVRGDAVKQRSLSGIVGGSIGHLQLNHNTDVPNPENPPTQRGRSVAFFAHGILAATTLQRYANG